MVIFKEYEVGINQLLEVVSEALLNHLSQNSKGGLLPKSFARQEVILPFDVWYGILENDRFRRTLEDTFNNPVFKMFSILTRRKVSEEA